MSDMPRKLPPYVTKEKNRHGKIVFYFRVGKGPRIRLPGTPGSKEFKAAYKAACSGQPLEYVAQSEAPRSIRWLVAKYMASTTWSDLAVATRKQRGLFYQQIIEASGNIDFRCVTTEDIRTAIKKRENTPSLANNFLKALRALFNWAVDNGHLETNPADGVKRLKTESGGFPVWTKAEIAQFKAHWSVGSRERLAFELLLASGLRRSDVVRVGKQHMQASTMRIRTQKTDTAVTLDFSQRMLGLIDESQTGDLAFVVGKKGNPMTKESFGNWFREACRAADVQKSAHGLRKYSATMAADAGATTHQLMAMFGWSTTEQAEIYTKAADRERLGKASSRLVAEHYETEFAPHLDFGAGKNGKSDRKS